MALFRPCENGVHVFAPEDEFGGVTVKNFPGADLAIFRQMSSAGDGDDFDLICDLHEGGDLIDCVVIRRQDLALIDRNLTLTAVIAQETTND